MTHAQTYTCMFLTGYCEIHFSSITLFAIITKAGFYETNIKDKNNFVAVIVKELVATIILRVNLFYFYTNMNGIWNKHYSPCIGSIINHLTNEGA